MHKKILDGKKIVITKADAQCSELKRQLECRGAEVLKFPLIEIKLADDCEYIDSVFSEITTYQWLILTSGVDADYFIARLFGLQYDLSILQNIRICVLGLETAKRVLDIGLNIDFMPAKYQLDNLVLGLEKRVTSNDKVLLVRAKEDNDLIFTKLSEKGAMITELFVIKQETPKISKEKIACLCDFMPIDVIIFTGSFCVQTMQKLKQFNHDFSQVIETSKLAVIGPVTKKAAEEAGLHVDIMPRETSIEGLVDSIVEYYTMRGNEDEL